MGNAVSLDDPHFEPWLKEGVSIEVHTLTHPCPLLAKRNFQTAADSYHGCVDLLNHIPGNSPVAFRMPCCDSLNTPSPRFYAEMFNSTNPAGQFLSIDSSVMNIPTSADPTIPRALVVQEDGKERFRKYLPFPSFVTTIENYPYPYVIDRLCWEFPAMVPSDWEGKNLLGTNNPAILADWKMALDLTVLKQGTFTFIFHPYGWMKPDRFVDFIDYAVAKYGKKVKFLNFREALERINANLLTGQPLRSFTGQDNGVRLLDVNNDGYLDVLIGNKDAHRLRIWQPKTNGWRSSPLPVNFVFSKPDGQQSEVGWRFGVVGPNHSAAMLLRNGAATIGGVTSKPIVSVEAAYVFDDTAEVFRTNANQLLRGLELDSEPVLTSLLRRDRGVRLRDINNDGQCELIVGNESQSAVFSWSEPEQTWKRAPYKLPEGTAIVDEQGRDAGLRFVDLNTDGSPDILFSNERRYSLHLFRPSPDPV
jgi:hypothetical protein